MDVNEDSVAPWKADGMDDACAEEGVEGDGAEHVGMKDVTTATGCAISRRSARILWESPRTLLLPVTRLEEGQRFAVPSASATRDMGLKLERQRGYGVSYSASGQCLHLLDSS